MSWWVNFRNTVEAAFEPEVKEAISFVDVIKTDVKAQAGGDLAAAFVAGYTAYQGSVGSFEQNIVTALEAFAASLLGYAVTIVKTAATNAEVAKPETALQTAS